jgi:hypothetical protein
MSDLHQRKRDDSVSCRRFRARRAASNCSSGTFLPIGGLSFVMTRSERLGGTVVRPFAIVVRFLLLDIGKQLARLAFSGEPERAIAVRFIRSRSKERNSRQTSSISREVVPNFLYALPYDLFAQRRVSITKDHEWAQRATVVIELGNIVARLNNHSLHRLLAIRALDIERHPPSSFPHVSFISYKSVTLNVSSLPATFPSAAGFTTRIKQDRSWHPGVPRI